MGIRSIDQNQAMCKCLGNDAKAHYVRNSTTLFFKVSIDSKLFYHRNAGILILLEYCGGGVWLVKGKNDLSLQKLADWVCAKTTLESKLASKNAWPKTVFPPLYCLHLKNLTWLFWFTKRQQISALSSLSHIFAPNFRCTKTQLTIFFYFLFGHIMQIKTHYGVFCV